MRIVCPSCAAAYEIADGLLVKPKTVRCSRCAEEWEQAPIPPAEGEALGTEADRAAAPPAEGAPELGGDPVHAPLPPSPMATQPAEPLKEPAEPLKEPAEPLKETDRLPRPARQAGAAGLALAWIASLLLLALLAFVAYRFRAEIQLAWPPSTRLFRLLAD